jgi:hypothetical protein
MALPRATLAPPKPRKPTFRLLIPSVQLAVISYLDPDLRVSEASGVGSLSAEARTEFLRYGKLQFNMVGKASLEYKWVEGFRPKIIDIYNSFREAGVPDISLNRLCIVKRAKIRANPTFIELRFGKDTVHPEVYDKLVVDGTYPKQETAEMIKMIKKDLATSIPRASIKRIRYSCLILHRILPEPNLIYDAHAVYALGDTTYMRLIKEIYKRWQLYDYEYLAKFKP